MVVRVDSNTVKPPWNWEAWQADAAARLEARGAACEAARAERLARGEETYAERIARGAMSPAVQAVVASAPPLTAGQIGELKRIFRPYLNPNPEPAEKPKVPRRSGRTIDPALGTLYARHLRATDGPCGKCGANGPREVDHCHAHLIVRGLICRACNATEEGNMGEAYRARCRWCAWDIWLAKELAR